MFYTMTYICLRAFASSTPGPYWLLMIHSDSGGTRR